MIVSSLIDGLSGILGGYMKMEIDAGNIISVVNGHFLAFLLIFLAEIFCFCKALLSNYMCDHNIKKIRWRYCIQCTPNEYPGYDTNGLMVKSQ